MPTVRKRKQFRWLTVWLMPIPAAFLVVVALAWFLRESLHQLWARVLLCVVAAAIYGIGSFVLRRAIPELEKTAGLQDGNSKGGRA